MNSLLRSFILVCNAYNLREFDDCTSHKSVGNGAGSHKCINLFECEIKKITGTDLFISGLRFNNRKVIKIDSMRYYNI